MMNVSHTIAAPGRWRRPRLAVLAGLWVARIRQRRSLAELDDRLRRDIGLSAADVASEAAKPFWRG